MCAATTLAPANVKHAMQVGIARTSPDLPLADAKPAPPMTPTAVEPATAILLRLVPTRTATPLVAQPVAPTAWQPKLRFALVLATAHSAARPAADAIFVERTLARRAANPAMTARLGTFVISKLVHQHSRSPSPSPAPTEPSPALPPWHKGHRRVVPSCRTRVTSWTP